MHTLSEVIGLQGAAGRFAARVRRQPRYVDPDLCVGCSLCSEACPAVRPNPYDVGMKAAKAIDRPFPQAVPATFHIDREACLNDDFLYCDRCLRACEPNAIDFDDKPEDYTLDVGAVVVATGFDELDPRELQAFGYGRALNVLTGLEFERLLCATGPTRGHVVRPSDHRVPERIVFVQCVGSRGEGGRPYCSRYCCMNSVKAAMLAHEHEPDIRECVLLYTDMRASGRGYDAFVARTLKRDDVRHVRGRPAKIQEDPATGDLTVWVEDFRTGRPNKLEAGMVVLSVAALPPRGSAELADVLGVELDAQGFYRRRDPENAPAELSRRGVYVAGSAGAPAIIPECVAQGGAAAVEAAVHVLDHRQGTEEAPPPQMREAGGEPRVGVFVCHCGANIAGVVDPVGLAAEARKLPGVVYVTDDSFACADVAQRAIEAAIAEHRLNRVVVAACTPRTHEPVFREVLARTGLNPYLVEMVNIRDQCTWVHAHVPDKAYLRARDQIRMGVARAVKLEPLTAVEVQVNRRALVVGGGVAGMRAAIDLDAQGYEVVLIEKTGSLGGILQDPGLETLYGSGAPGAQKLAALRDQLASSRVDVRLRTDLAAVHGYLGNFRIELTGTGKGSKISAIETGTIILATGARIYDPTGSFGHGTKRNVVTSVQLEQRLADTGDKLFGEGGAPPASAVFIQCVGSRREREGCNPGCSRYCCPATVQQALQLARRGVKTTVLYRDMRCVSPGAEELYREARGAGVLFIRVPDDHEPEVVGTKTIAKGVVARDVMLGRDIEAPADLVVLAVGMIPDAEVVPRLREILKIPLGPDGFFMERHPELGPVETVIDGVFVCGSAVGAKPISDSLNEAAAAAGKAGQIMSRTKLALEPTLAEVDPLRCRGCGTCLEICEFNAPSLAPGELGVPVATINKASCKGCGTCVAWCPGGAITARHFTDPQIEAMMESLLLWEETP
ncbi:FAD-dependent oxidoreductase [bacterium]|nr:FAD-dependent oxidoreductase [bacterium]